MDSATTQENPVSCCVCFFPPTNDQENWRCTQCNNTCHLHCILQWVLRQVLNTPGPRRFTCPICRAGHFLSELPGFEGERIPPQPTVHASVLQFLSDVIPLQIRTDRLPSSSATSRHDHEAVPMQVDVQVQEEQDEEGSQSNGAVLYINTQSVNLTIHTIERLTFGR